MHATIHLQSKSRVSAPRKAHLLFSLLPCKANYDLLDKDQWIGKERVRWAKYFSVPISEQMPEGFPVKTLPVQRVLCALSQKAPANLPSVMEALFRSLWIDRNSKTGEPEGFTPVLESVIGAQATQEVLQAVRASAPFCGNDKTNSLIGYSTWCQGVIDLKHRPCFQGWSIWSSVVRVH